MRENANVKARLNAKKGVFSAAVALAFLKRSCVHEPLNLQFRGTWVENRTHQKGIYY